LKKGIRAAAYLYRTNDDMTCSKYPTPEIEPLKQIRFTAVVVGSADRDLPPLPTPFLCFWLWEPDINPIIRSNRNVTRIVPTSTRIVYSPIISRPAERIDRLTVEKWVRVI
jgi:hypothetical protein